MDSEAELELAGGVEAVGELQRGAGCDVVSVADDSADVMRWYVDRDGELASVDREWSEESSY